MKNIFKLTPIGEIPEEWQVVRLGDVADINKESRDPSREIPDDKFLYIDIESVEGETGVIKTAKEILGNDAPSRARRVIHENNVIISMVRPYLKAFALVPKEYNNQICSTGFAVLSCKNEITPQYLLYTLFSKEVIEQCNKKMVGGQYPALNQSQVAEIKIPLPPLPEQRRIAEILNTVDSAIQRVSNAIEKTERLKRGLMQRLLTQGIGHERFKETEAGRIPEEWGVRAIGEIAKTSSGGTPSRNKKEYFVGNIPWVKSGELKDNIIFETEEKITENGLQNSSAKLFPKGTLLIALYGATVGKTGILGINATTNQAVCAILSKKDLIDQKFWQYYLIFRRKQLISISSGGAQPNISQEIIKIFKIPIPPLAEQRRIAEILSTVDEKLELERKRKEKLERIKKGLMNDLLTGRKRVKMVGET